MVSGLCALSINIHINVLGYWVRKFYMAGFMDTKFHTAGLTLMDMEHVYFLGSLGEPLSHTL